MLLLDENLDNKRSDGGGVWFGPRLGKRAVEFAFEDNRYKTDDKRRENVLFTPRIGRSQSDDLPRDDYSDRADAAVDPMDNRVRYFSPRLGRTMNFSPRLGRSMDFSPRLGRELIYELYPDKIRVARSANKTKST
ncbi:PBAN-type neuropeptides-like [Hyposmocoma kahamanoa]|uniref:PBAN-type neuropeptides-like n=1 Tax=Hyposmocoma kahamanoa TaxID=1477025 RepID=UPI000E6D6BA2|nr:PBAN-type neuropeptides-like [Hyposmocoma kahamanoa]